MSWLIRLVIATIFFFGIKRGVGAESLSEYFQYIRITTHVGLSPSSVRKLQGQVESVIVKFGEEQVKSAISSREEPLEVVGGVDETFFEQMVLVMMDIPSGYILLESYADERTSATWYEKIQQSLGELSIKVHYLVSDRAKGLIKLALSYFECPSIADLFHLLNDISKGFSLVTQTHLRQAGEALQKAQEQLAKIPTSQTQLWKNQQKQVVQAQQLVQKWATVQQTYQALLNQFSLTVHPFCVEIGCPQSTADLICQLQTIVSLLEQLAQTHHFTKALDRLKTVKNHMGSLATLIDVWWDWVDLSVADISSDTTRQQWLKTILLPKLYWEYQLNHCRSPLQLPFYQAAYHNALNSWQHHPLTHTCNPDEAIRFDKWANSMITRFQRASSAVEGRNGYLSQIHQARRGLTPRQLQVLTVLHNFQLVRNDGSTPAQRFFQQPFPDLFEAVLAQFDSLPLPRRSKLVPLNP